MVETNPLIELNKIPAAVTYILDKFNIEVSEDELKELCEQAYYKWCSDNNLPYARGKYNF